METQSMGHGGLFVFFSKRMKCSARPTLLMQVAEINVLLHSAQLPEAQLNHLKVHTFQYALLEISAMDGKGICPSQQGCFGFSRMAHGLNQLPRMLFTLRGDGPLLRNGRRLFRYPHRTTPIFRRMESRYFPTQLFNPFRCIEIGKRVPSIIRHAPNLQKLLSPDCALIWNHENTIGLGHIPAS